MTAGRRSFRLNRAAQTVLVAGILVAANLIAQRWFARLDLTARREYTLAASTKKTLAGLDDTVVVNAYFSRRLPPYLAHLRRQVQDMLEEYRAYSGGRVSIEFTDPGDDPGAAAKLRAMGIPQVQLEVLERDQFQVSAAWMGLALLYGGRQEVIPIIQDTGNLEYELTAALLRLTSPQKKGVGWVGGRERDPRERGADPIRRELGRLYDLRELNAETLDAVPEGVDTLLLAGPRALPERARFAVDQFIMRGGRAVFLVDHLDLPEGTLFPEPMESGVHDLLANYGVKAAKDVVSEPHYNAPAAFSSGFVQFRIPYPYWVRVTRETLDREHPVTARVEEIVLPWPSSLEAAVPPGARVKPTVLAKSSPDARAETAGWDFSPQPRRGESARGEVGQRSLAVLLTGKFTSFWKDREPPAPVEGKPGKVVAESPETSILVIGTSHLAEREFLRQFPENGAFLLNAVDWMTMGPDLIGIRSRVAADPVLPPVPDRVRTGIKAVNIVGVPLLLALAALVRLSPRRRRHEE